MDQFTWGLRERTRQEREHVEGAGEQPHRRGFPDPLDPKLECLLGRLAVRGLISKEEYNAGVKWRGVHLSYLHSIESPDEFIDEEAENAAQNYRVGLKILMGCGRRVFHAVCSIATYDESDELGDFEFTLGAARTGFAALAKSF